MKRKHNSGLWLRFDRVLAHDLKKQLLILAVALFVAFCLSYLFLSFSGSDWRTFCNDKGLKPWLLPLYLLIDSNALNNLYIGDIYTAHYHPVRGWMLFASSLTFLFGAFIFNGMIISVMTTTISRRVDEHRGGLIHYLKSGHYIIMGYDDMIPSIIVHVFEKDKDAYVLLLTSADVLKIREKLKKSFTEQQMQKIVINYGHRTSAETYKEIFLESAEQVYIVGNRTRPAHDAINVECVDSICSYLNQPHIKQRPRRITCVFEDLDTYEAFKTSEIFQGIRELGIEFVPYNFFTNWAKQVFIKRFHKDMDNLENPIIHYPAVYGQGVTPDDGKYVHLVFVGTTNFAVAFAMEAAHVLHFPNFNHDKRLKTRITFIDLNADKEMPLFVTRNHHFFEVQSYYYQDLSENSKTESCQSIPCTYFTKENGYGEEERDFLDVEFEFIKGDVFSPKVQELIIKWTKSEDQYLSLFLAMADQRSNFIIGMNMPDEVYDNEVSIFIRQDRSDNFVTNLRNTDNKQFDYFTVDKDGVLKRKELHARYSHIYPFGMNETAYSADENSLRRAKLINYLYSTANYNTYKFQGILALDTIPKEKIWADANKRWNQLSVAHKWSNLYNAYTIRTKLATLRAMRGLPLDDCSHDLQSLSDREVEELARVEHNRWNVEKLLMGFRKARREEDKYKYPEHADKLGKNKNLFIHHDIRHFDDLGVIKDLDREFAKYLPWIMRMTEEYKHEKLE